MRTKEGHRKMSGCSALSGGWMAIPFAKCGGLKEEENKEKIKMSVWAP